MNFKAIGLVVLSVALAVPLVGQSRRGNFPGPAATGEGERIGGFQGRGPSPSGRLEEALDLTPSQVASLEALFEQQRNSQDNLREQRIALGEALRAAIDSGDTTAIGNAVLNQRALQEQMRSMNEDFRGQMRNQLTLDQQERLDALEAFGGGRGFGPGPGGRAFRGRGVFGPPPAAQ